MLKTIILNLLLASPPPNEIRNKDNDFYDNLVRLTDISEERVFSDALIKQLACRWLVIKNTDNSYCKARQDWLNQLCLQLALVLEPKHPYRLLMPDLKGKQDTFGALFDNLGIDDFITTAEDDFFIVLDSFFELVWQRVRQKEPNALEYINSAQAPTLLKEKDIASIAQLIPASPFFFQAITSPTNYDSETVLDKLQALRQGLLTGSVRDQGTELAASSAADIAITTFYKYYETLSSERRDKLRAFTSNDAKTTLGNLLDLLFKPLEEASSDSTRYCVSLLGRDLETIINKNTNLLYQENASNNAYWYAQVKRCFDKPILAAINADDSTRFQYHLPSTDITTFLNTPIDDEQNTILHQCSTDNSLMIIDMLLQHDIDVQAKNKQGKSPLRLAVVKGHLAIVKRLLKHPDIAVNQPCHKRVTPLRIAAQEGHLAVVECLLKHPDISVNQPCYQGATPLLIAAQEGHLAVVESLLKHPDIAVNQPCHKGATPLRIAAQNGHLAVVECLLKHPNIAVNQPYYQGATLLRIAAQNGHLAIVECLLKHPDIAVNQPCHQGRTSLRVAAKNGHTTVFIRLFEHAYFSNHPQDILGQFAFIDNFVSFQQSDIKKRFAQIAIEHHINHAKDTRIFHHPLNRYSRCFDDIIQHISWTNRHSSCYKLILSELKVNLLAEIRVNPALIDNYGAEIKRILGYQRHWIPNLFGTKSLSEFETLVILHESQLGREP